jgi:hypothetical protein
MQALKREIQKIGSLALFFFIGFGYILLLVKLFLEDYSIDTYVFSKAIVGALVAAKAVAIMDMTPWLNRFHQSPRYISVLYKTFVYTLAVLIIGVIENFLHAYYQTKRIAPAIAMLIETRHISHFLAITLCISSVFLIHNVFQSIDDYLGKGNLTKFFLNRP